MVAMVRVDGSTCALAVGLGLVGLLGAARPVAAQPASPPAPRPWQVGVTDGQKATAQRWLDQGNELFVQDRYKDALVAYQQGLAVWDHPAIRFNVARTLIALDRLLEAEANLEAAMAHGAEPLADVWAEAVNYRTLLAHQLATLAVRCTQAGVAVSLDGEALAPCPAETSRRVLPGRHVVVARRPDYLTITREPVVLGGQPARVDLTLIALRDAAVTRTRWPIWKPWAVVGAAAAVAGLGAVVELDARATLDDYRAALADECGERGCAGGRPSAATAALERRAVVRDRVGVSLMVAGGVGLATGVALLLANRPFTALPDQRGPRALTIAPLIADDAIGLVLSAAR